MPVQFSEGLCPTKICAIVNAGELIDAVMIVRCSSEDSVYLELDVRDQMLDGFLGLKRSAKTYVWKEVYW